MFLNLSSRTSLKIDNFWSFKKKYNISIQYFTRVYYDMKIVNQTIEKKPHKIAIFFIRFEHKSEINSSYI